jgi:diguanylate cyclase (GGDEF)-like protein/PAS domain S-box-containing protein
LDLLQEQKRINAVNSLEILDTPNESDFDELVNLASMIFEVPISTVTIVDSHRQWFKAAVGLTVKETSREVSFCTHAIQQHDYLVVTDTSNDPRFANNPLVIDEPHLAFYAGIPLRTSNNLAVGTFCIMDKIPRELSDRQIEILRILANQTMQLLELRSERNKYRDLVLEKDFLNKQLEESNQRWKFALEGSGDGVWDWDVEHNICFFSKKWKEMLGYSENELANTYESWISLIHRDDKEKVLETLNDYLDTFQLEYKLELRMLCKDLSYKWVLTRGMVVERNISGHPMRMVGTHTDISNRKKNEEIIWQQANFDALTGLPNRRMFFDRLNEQIKRATRTNSTFALMYIDLDGFKSINDNLGHEAGDSLLVKVSKRISQCIRDSDTSARLGGDEFTIILSDLENMDAIDSVAEKLLSAINQPYQLGSNVGQVSASIGVAVYPNNGNNRDTLISVADSAMYEAKAKGKNCWVLGS